MDRERASLDRSLESLRGVCGRAVIPIQLPIGDEHAFTGVVDLVAMKALIFAGRRQRQVDRERRARRHDGGGAAAREALIEMVAEADEQLMETFFEAGTLTQEQLVGGLERDVAAEGVSARLHVGHAQHRRPAAARRHRHLRAVAGRAAVSGARRDGDAVEIARPRAAPTAAFVWKTIADPFAGRITMFRVVSGTLKADSTSTTRRATRPSVSAICSCCRARHRPTCPSSRPATSARSRS